MGTKRTWNGKYVFLYITCIVITAIGLQGCTYFVKRLQDKQHDEQGFTMAKVPMDEGDNEEPSLKEIKEVLNLFPEFAKKWQGKQSIAEARTLMFKGDFEASIKLNKDVLRQFPLTLGDQALFQMGLNYAHPEKANPDNQKAIECFQGVLEDFPKSSIRDEAGIWILFLQKTIENNKRFEELQSQKDDLRDQIEKHKKIDLQKTIENNKKLEELQSQKEDLKDQIEKLKKIDLGIEDKKRIDSSK